MVAFKATDVAVIQTMTILNDFREQINMFKKKQVVAVEEAVAHFPVTRDFLEYCAHCTKTLVTKVCLIFFFLRPLPDMARKLHHQDCLSFSFW